MQLSLARCAASSLYAIYADGASYDVMAARCVCIYRLGGIYAVFASQRADLRTRTKSELMLVFMLCLVTCVR